MTRFRDALDRFGVFVLDGGTATELERRGADLSGGLWSTKTLIENPSLVEDLHLDYLRAGADIVEAATYQATVVGLTARGYSLEAVHEIFRSAFAVADQARARRRLDGADSFFRPPPMIAAALGPYGAFLTGGREFDGRYDLSPAELSSHHRRQIDIIGAIPFDLLAFETFPRIDEATICAEAANERALDVWISFTSPDGRKTGFGEPLEDAARALSKYPNVVALGINCTAPRFVEDALRRLASATDRPLVAYPNSGEIWVDDRWHAGDAEVDFGTLIHAWMAAGARIIGGCCRTGPKDVRRIANLLARRP